MGCWNKTCGISQLPIFAGDKTVNFIIIEQTPFESDSPTNNHPSYSSAYWNIIPLPFYGEYNDYGWQDDSEGQQWKYELLHKQFGERVKLSQEGVKEGESKYTRYDGAEKNPFKDNKSLGDAIHGNLCTITPYITRNPKGAAISSIMISKATFDELTESFTSGPRWEKDEIVVSKTEMVEYAEKIKSVVGQYTRRQSELEQKMSGGTSDSDDKDEKIKELLEELRELQVFSGVGMFAMEEKVLTSLGIAKEDRYYHPAVWFWNWFSANGGSEHGYDQVSFLRDTRMDIPAQELVDAFAFQYVMDGLRKQIIPQGHEGSQDGISELHSKFAKAYQARIDEYDAWMEENSEDDY